MDWWRCTICGAEGRLADVFGKPCPFDHPPCRWCGQTPFCAQDCPVVLDALARPDVYIAGGGKA